MPSNFNQALREHDAHFRQGRFEALRDLEDALDINGPTAIDQFNQSDKGNTPRVDTGITLAASGKGAETAIQEYSKDIQPGNGNDAGLSSTSRPALHAVHAYGKAARPQLSRSASSLRPQ